MWQGLLALKNDTAAVQLHFVSGNNVLAHRSLPLSEGGPPLRIAQRMRLEASQLEGVARRMTVRLMGGPGKCLCSSQQGRDKKTQQ